jgi:antitoxin YefM
MSETMSLAVVKEQFSEIVDRVNKQHDRVIVTRDGVPAIVLVSVEELESLDETLEILFDQRAMDAIRESEREVASNLDAPVTEDEARARWDH